MAGTYDLVAKVVLSTTSNLISVTGLNSIYSAGYKNLHIFFLSQRVGSHSVDIRFNSNTTNGHYAIVGRDMYQQEWGFTTDRFYDPSAYWDNQAPMGMRALECEIHDFGNTSTNEKTALITAGGKRFGVSFGKYNIGDTGQAQAISSIQFSDYNGYSFQALTTVEIFGVKY